MQVNAIQNNLGFTGRHRRVDMDRNSYGDRNLPENPYNNNVSNSAMSKATKGMVVALMMLPVAGSLASCDADAYAESHAVAIDSCKCKPINGRDTITIHDTIQQIITKPDTVYIKKGFDSPVIDTLRHFFEENGIDPGDKRIPVKITWVDENNVPAYNKMLFDGKSSSYNELSYDNTRTPWNDEQGSFVIGVGDKYENIRYSLSNGKLVMQRYVPRNESRKPTSRGDWMYANSAVYDIKSGKKIVDRYTVENNGNMKYAGSFRPGDKPNTIFVTNPYGTDWRYTNVKVTSEDAPNVDY